MATLVTFHAHPDDECIGTGGVMRKAHEEGHRVVLVVATRGELGEIPPGLLAEGETLTERRVKETHASADILGVDRVEFLPYTDSGMAGDATNDDEGTFWTADVEKAARQLADILVEEKADVLTCYDDNGGYGHPDHIQVHRVGVRAGELAGTPRVYQNTQNRDEFRKRSAAFAEREGVDMPPPDFEIGKPEAELTGAVDVRDYLGHKRKAMRAHASQISEESFFLSLPDEIFAEAFGVEWFIRAGQGPGITETDIMAGL
ncbi:PIG-L family deacetylase [Amycolatopsis sp. CA-230715]|uniref:PIG-L family deacetylase n=1 Tax=Amycolatopsis sp. CA-230715 TaxID=2745196 RepID=UPI001C032284|nr:PIG-L family deacetylase [Amycolatopsis sp. CA-230715]QWF78305.1 1D-myo-inositol 2-acetamido-2-deoxy-alpha-D-glucopyranoside deacetylase [Amycolatopsis sp. CA-230715]